MDLIKKTFGIDLRSLALFRIGLAILVLSDLINRSSDLIAHYTDFGVLPRGPLIENFSNLSYFSLYFTNGTFEWATCLFVVNAMLAVALLLGYKTRWVMILCWVLNVSLQNRNPIVLQGGDILLRCLMFWAMFLPLGSRYSIDHALSFNTESKKNTYMSPNLIISGATVALLLQVCIVYWSTAILKNGKEYYPDGTATYLTLMIDQFVTPLGVWVRQFEGLLKPLTFAVFGWEAIGGFLLLVPFWAIRLFAVLMFLVMHLSFGALMELGLFPYIDAVSFFVFIPSKFWDYFAEKISKKNLIIFYDNGCLFCEKMVLIIKEFFFLEAGNIAIAQRDKNIEELMLKNRSWVFKDARGLNYFQGEAFLVFLSHFAPFVWIKYFFSNKALIYLSNFSYRLVADRRGFLSQYSKKFLPFKDIDPRTSIFNHLFCIFLLALVIAWNMSDFPNVNIQIPTRLKSLIWTLRMDQKWDMFAPYPMRDDGWYVFSGQLRDGTEINTFTWELGAPSQEKPVSVADTYPNQRWRKYLMNVWRKSHSNKRIYLGRYFCRNWNAKHSYEKELLTHQITFMKEYTHMD